MRSRKTHIEVGGKLVVDVFHAGLPTVVALEQIPEAGGVDDGEVEFDAGFHQSDLGLFYFQGFLHSLTRSGVILEVISLQITCRRPHFRQKKFFLPRSKCR